MQAQAREQPSAVLARDLWKQYSLGDVTVDALRGVDLELPAGRFVVLVGPSGSGKTTLLNLAGGLDIPTRGELSVFGFPLSGMDEDQLTDYRRTTVGFVFQMFNLVPTLTALENVRLVAQLVGTDELSRQVLADVGLSPGPTTFRLSSAGASSSGWPSPAPSSNSPAFCSPTSPPERSTSRPGAACYPSSGNRPAAVA